MMVKKGGQKYEHHHPPPLFDEDSRGRKTEIILLKVKGEKVRSSSWRRRVTMRMVHALEGSVDE